MALTEPTTKEINDQIIANIEANIAQVIPLVPKATFRVLSASIAAVFTILYKFGSWQFLQIFPSTAEEDSLERWGNLIGVVRTPAEPARIEILCTGTDGQQVLTGTRLTSNLTGVVYIVDSDATIAGGVATTTAIASQAGSIGNVENSIVLAFVTPLPGIDNTATVTDTIDIGVDAENLDIYRDRVVNRFRKVPQGGALADYEAWGLEVATIQNVFPYSGDIEGTVQVFSESSVSPDGIPTAGELIEVFDSINLPTRRPVTAEVFSLPIIRVAFTVTVFGLSPDTAEAKTNIETRLGEYFLGRAPFIDGLSIINDSLISQTDIVGIIGLALQTTDSIFDTSVFEVTGTGDTLTRYNLGQGEMAKLDAVVYA